MLSVALVLIAFGSEVATIPSVPRKLTELESFCGDRQNYTKDVVLLTLFRYFKDQHSVTFIDRSDDPVSNFFACSNKTIFNAIKIFRSADFMNFGDEIAKNSVTSFPEHEGYYLVCTRDDVVNGLIPKIAAHNPKTKVLINLLDSQNISSFAAKEITKIAFDRYKMFNVAVVAKNEKSSSICVYNPFSINSNNLTAMFNCGSTRVHSLEEAFAKIDDLAAARLGDLHKFPLRVHMLPYHVYAKPVFDANKKLLKYSYIDGAVLDILAEKLNFKPAFLNSTLDDKFSVKNSTLSGSSLLLEMDAVDYVANARLISNYETKKALHLRSFTMVKYKFVIKTRERTRRFLASVMVIFEAKARIVATLLMFLMPLTFCIIKFYELKICKMKSKSVIENILHVFAIYHHVSVKHSSFTSTRIVTITIVFCALIFNSLMQGSIVKMLNNSKNYDAIDTIQELLEKNFNLLVPRILNNFMKVQSGTVLYDKLRKVSEESTGVTTAEGLRMVLEGKDVASVMSESYCGNYLNQFYDPLSGENLRKVIPENAFELYLAYMVPKVSPFIKKFNEIISHIVESGIDVYHYKQAEIDNDDIWFRRMRGGLTPKAQSLALKFNEFKGMFQLYLWLICVCVVFFCAEICVFNLKRFLKRF